MAFSDCVSLLRLLSTPIIVFPSFIKIYSCVGGDLTQVLSELAREAILELLCYTCVALYNVKTVESAAKCGVVLIFLTRPKCKSNTKRPNTNLSTSASSATWLPCLHANGPS